MKKRRTVAIAILLVTILAMGVMAHADESKPYEGKKLTWITGVMTDEVTDQAWYEEHIKEFTVMTGAEVEVSVVAYKDLDAKMMADLIAGEGADILWISGGHEIDFFGNGYLEDLTDYFTEDVTSDWPYYELKQVNGAHYVVPADGGLAYRCFFINKTMCEELGLEVPAHGELTWDMMVEYAQKAVEAGYKGFENPFSGNENAIICNYFNYVNQAGGSLTDDTGMWDFTSPEALTAMTFVYDMFNTYKIIDSVEYEAATCLSDFAEGGVLFTQCNIGGIQSYLEEGVPFEWDVYNIRGPQGDTGVFNTVDSFAVNSASENKELACEFIKWFMSKDNYLAYREICSNAAATTSSDPASCLMDEYQYLVADATNVYMPPMAEHSAEIKEALQTHQQLCGLGEETAEEALAAIQAVVDSYKE